MPKNRIAIVEDEGIVAMDISKCLTSLGYEVAFIADSGEKALENLISFPSDMILMDVELKGEMNGLDTAAIVKEKFKIPVVFLTAFEDDSTLSRIGSITSDGFLVKPFEDEELKRTVERVLSV